MLPFINVFDRAISMYWLSAAVGIILACGLALLRAKSGRFRVSVKDVFITFLFVIAGARIGGILFKVVGHIFLYANTPDFWTAENWMMLLRSGGVLYGGIICGFLAGLVYVRKRKIDFRDITDIIVPSVALFLVFGRLGCFFAGCCYGRASAWGITMPNGMTLLPVQLVEAGFNLVLLIEMLRLRPERERPGVLLPVYLVAYAIGRFLIEFMRGDANRGVYLLSTSQWISLLLLLALAFTFWVKRKKRVKPKEN